MNILLFVVIGLAVLALIPMVATIWIMAWQHIKEMLED